MPRLRDFAPSWLRRLVRRHPWLCRPFGVAWERPLFMLTMRWRTRQPETFNEKVRYKLARDRRPLLTTFADKVAAREYVRQQVGAELLSTVYAVVDDVTKFDWTSLPNEYACKAAHSSGGVILVWKGADPQTALPPRSETVGWEELLLHPDQVDPHRLTEICGRWLRTPYAWGCGKFQWAYRDVPRRLLIEELLVDSSGQLAPNWLFFVLNGRCRLVRGRLSEGRRGFFSPDGEQLEVGYVPKDSRGKPRHTPIRDVSVPPLPSGQWHRMIDIAERLGADTDFVRVDLYDVDGRVVFGELTNYPSRGTRPFDPPEFDYELGRYWTVPKRYSRS